MNLVNEGVLPPDELDDRDERREEQESRETVADIVAAMRAMARVSETFVDRFSNPCLRTMTEMEAKMRKSLADRIEAAARRAYNEIDRAVRETGRVNAEGVELIRTAMNNTIGEYCE